MHRMTITFRSRRLLAGGLLQLLPVWALALTQVHDIGFFRPDVSPWQQGGAFQKDWSRGFGSTLETRMNLNDLSASSALAGFLSDYVPEIGFAKATVDLRAMAELQLGYEVSSGWLGLQYPGQMSLDFQTSPAGASSGRWQQASTRFTPGLNRLVVPPLGDLAGILGPGYVPNPVASGLWFDSYRSPTFRTEFPYAQAWADLKYDVRADLNLSAGLARVGDTCIACVSFKSGIGAADTQPLLRVSPDGLEVLGEMAVPVFGQTFGFGAGTVELNYPKVSVTGQLQADGRSLRGRDSRELIRFNGAFDKLVPVVGAFLSHQVGPFDVTLLSIQGGPTLGVYQEFEVKVKPRTRLEFSSPVVLELQGQQQVGTSFEFDSDADFRWLTPVGFRDTLRVKPTYLLGGTVRNQTGVDLGVQLEIDALEVTAAPLPSAGPLNVFTFSDPSIVSFEVFDSGDMALAPEVVKGAPIDFAMHSLLGLDQPLPVALTGATRSASHDDGSYSYLLDFSLGGTPWQTLARGTAIAIPGIDGSDGMMLQTLAPVTLSFADIGCITDVCTPIVFDFGSLFCVDCNDRFDALADDSLYIDDGNGRLYVNHLDEVVLDAGQLSARSTVHDPLDVAIELGPIVPVPEPATGALWLAGLACMAGLARRRG